jgi:hypothetical protein
MCNLLILMDTGSVIKGISIKDVAERASICGGLLIMCVALIESYIMYRLKDQFYDVYMYKSITGTLSKENIQFVLASCVQNFIIAICAFTGISLKYTIHIPCTLVFLFIISLIKFVWSSILFYIYFMSENWYENLFTVIESDGYFNLIFLKMEMITAIVLIMVCVFLIYTYICMPKYSTGVVNYAVSSAIYGIVVSVAREKTQFNIIKTDKHEIRYAPNILVVNKLTWIKIINAIISSILLIIGIHHSIVIATNNINMDDIVNCTHNNAVKHIKNCAITSAIIYYIASIYYAIAAHIVKTKTPVLNMMCMIIFCVSKIWSYYLFINVSYFDCIPETMTSFYGFYSIVEIDMWSILFIIIIPCTILSTNRNYFIETKYPGDTTLEMVAYSNYRPNENIVNAVTVST